MHEPHEAADACAPVVAASRGGELVEITFDGRRIEARAGEPLAAALYRAGVRVFRTMPDTGEARGGYCLVGRCADCLVVVDGVPNVRACVTPVAAGMAVRTQHGLGEGEWTALAGEAVR